MLLTGSPYPSRPKGVITMIDTPRDLAAKIIQHYGAQHQLVKLMEECAELIQQAAKCHDKNTPYNADFVEELADVRVMMLQFEAELYKSAYWANFYMATISAKLRRQLERIKAESDDAQ